MSTTIQRLDGLCDKQPKFLGMGGLCVGLVVTQMAKDRGLPLEPESLRTGERGQVAGLGKAAVQKILEAHGISRVLAQEGGRTSRGSLGLMEDYVAALNEMYEKKALNLEEAQAWWIAKVRAHFASKGPKFHFDPGKSLRANIQDLLKQADDLQQHSGGTAYVGAMLQHLVGAKLDVVVGPGKIEHHGFSVADQSTARQSDFQIETVAIHVTTHPSESLVMKCEENLRAGLKPLIITMGVGVEGAAFLLKNFSLSERVDVLDVAQFLTANVYERSQFRTAACKATFANLLDRYNDIVALCETDPAMRIALKPETTEIQH
jgi:hypothetical protein